MPELPCPIHRTTCLPPALSAILRGPAHDWVAPDGRPEQPGMSVSCSIERRDRPSPEGVYDEIAYGFRLGDKLSGDREVWCRATWRDALVRISTNVRRSDLWRVP